MRTGFSREAPRAVFGNNASRRPSCDDHRLEACATLSGAGLYAEEVADEEVGPAAGAVGGGAYPVVGAGDYQQVEVLVGLDQGVDGLHGRCGVHVPVHLAHDQEQLSPQPVGVGDV